ncbi:MAG: alanine--glyoxylate aminotransferase family protein [Gemmatimonadetes bacterium]|nr:alanine--glyoxylate aminotransferase family protein [Gemmatimonadota bacterium]
MASRSADAPLLMTPGPTRVPDRVLAAGAVPMIHHRTPEFSQIHAAVLEQMKPLFGTSRTVLPVYATGRGGMEAGITNLLSPGDEIVVSCNGRFGEMWAELATSYGLGLHRVCTDWMQSADPAEVEQVLSKNPNVRAVAITQSDTATGVLNDIQGVAAVARKHGALVLVDAISSLGGAPFEMDAWGVDCAVTGSQKCLMSSPGLAFVALSEGAWKAMETAKLPKNYWNLMDFKESIARGDLGAHRTSPVHLFMQVAEALVMIQEEGLQNVFKRHEALAERARSRAAALGIMLQCPDLKRLSPTVTAFALPNGVSPKAVRDGLRARGIQAAGGLGRLEANGFRIGHMGDIRMADVDRTMDALKEVLAD